ncbi:hypothetical protein [Clostridium tunisiense]|uniref:hypothetical protein n=1 Tax=Clostridium tunisiense TaxID=219748 RepID=UPI0002ECC584|nr:hypothetical protein [Clostridium tunisiense]
MLNWVLSILFITIIVRDFKITKELLIRAKKKNIDKIFLLICIGVLLYITYRFAKIQIHYFMGILSVVLIIAGYLKEGITLKGFASMYRGAQFISWNKVRNININKGETIKVSYSGEGFHHNLCFEKENYDKIVELLNEKLPSIVVNIDFDPM